MPSLYRWYIWYCGSTISCHDLFHRTYFLMVMNLVLMIVDTIFRQVYIVVTFTTVDLAFILVTVIVMIFLPLVSSSCSFHMLVTMF